MKMSSKKQEKRGNVVHLKKRSSHINTVYDDIIGPAIDYFNPSKLPQCRHILQQYRCLRSQDINIPLCNISNVISEELQKVWDLTVKSSIQRFIEQWNKTRPEKRPDVITNLDTLFDVRPTSLLPSDALVAHLKRFSCSCWEEELAFFIGQTQHPQTTCITTQIDLLKKMKDDKKLTKAAKYTEYKSKHKDTSPEETSTPATTTCRRKSANAAISEQDIVSPSAKRTQRKTLCKSYDVNEEVENSDDWSSTDQEWKPKLWKQYAAEDKFVSLNLPAKSIPSLLASVSTISKTSIRQELKLTSTLLKEGGTDLSKTSQSVSTVHRQRKLSVKEEAKKIRKKLQYESEEFLVAHWDSKIIQVSGKTQDRLAICIKIQDSKIQDYISQQKLHPLYDTQNTDT